MLPFEGIKTRQTVTCHPESCRIRPHSKVWGKNAGGGGAMVLRTYGSGSKAGGRPVLLPVKNEGDSPRSPKMLSPSRQGRPVAITSGNVSPPPDHMNVIKSPPLLSPFKVMCSFPVLDEGDEETTRPARVGSVCLTKLSPSSPTIDEVRTKLRKLDLTCPIPDTSPGLVCSTPRFHCPKNVDCTQGYGRQVIEGFAVNPDEDFEGVDQALFYHVQTQNDELFIEVPRCDYSGTLRFTPSSSRQGVAKCAIMVTDHAAVEDAEFKCSPWVGFTVTVQPSPIKVLKARDWRTFYNKMTAPTAAVPVPEELRGMLSPKSPRPEHSFPPVDIHFLRIPAEQKTNRDKALLLSKGLAPIKFLTFLNEIDTLRDSINAPKEASAGLDKAIPIVFDLSGGQELWEALLEDPVHPLENSDEHLLALGLASGKLGKVYFAMGDYQKTEKCFEVSITMYERYMGLEDVQRGDDEWLKALHNEGTHAQNLVSAITQLSIFLKHMGELTRCVQSCELALLAARNLSIPDRASYMAALLLQLAEVHLIVGNSERSLSMLQEAKTALEEVKGDKETLKSRDEKMADLEYLYGVYHGGSGRFAQSLQSFQRCMTMRRKLVGEGHPSVAEVHLAKSRIHEAHGKTEQCVKSAQDALDISEKKIVSWTGAMLHVYCLQALAHAYITKGKYSLSLPLLERAEERSHELHNSHPISGVGLVMLGAFHCSQKRFQSALENLREGLSILSGANGKGITVSITKAMMGAVLLQMGDVSGARRELDAAQSELLEVPMQYYVQSIVKELAGDALIETDRAAALEPYTEAYNMLKQVGPVERELRQTRLMGQLCGVYCGTLLKPPEHLVEEYKDVLKQKQQQHGEWDYHTCPLLQCVAELCYADCSYDEALESLQRMLKISDNQNLLFLLGNLFKPAAQLTEQQIKERNRLACEKISSAGAPSFAVVLLQLAAVQEAKSLWKEAEASYLQARATFEIAGKATHPGVCSALNGIGRILYNSGLYGDALSYFQKTLSIAGEARDLHKENHLQAQQCIQIVNKKLQSLKYLLERYEVCFATVCNPHRCPAVT